MGPGVERLIANFRARTPLRTGSLIVTFFGDCIAARGGSVWLGSLINVLSTLGISHRLVRTAVYRLVQDGILENEQVGRRSFYSLTPEGERDFSEATSRIYGVKDTEWNGTWTMLLLNQVPQDVRTQLKKDLTWLGFGQLSPDLYAHPHINSDTLQNHLDRFNCLDDVIRIEASPSANIARVVRDAWPIATVEKDYQSFIDLFDPIRDEGKDPDDAFYLRTFLIHEYRKVILRDPGIPDELLSESWIGHRALALAREIYLRTQASSEQYVDDHFECQEGPLPAPDSSFYERFKNRG